MLATHNTMTYLPPRHPWLHWLKSIAQCQTLDYIQQWDRGARAFDLRIFFNKYGIEYRHGIISYEASNLSNFLTFCNHHRLTVRVLFEERNWPHLKYRSKKHNYKQSFINFCKGIEKTYPHITFYGGWNTHTHELLHDFGNQVTDKQCYTSFTPFAWIYSRLHKVLDSDVVMHYDFI